MLTVPRYPVGFRISQIHYYLLTCLLFAGAIAGQGG